MSELDEELQRSGLIVSQSSTTEELESGLLTADFIADVSGLTASFKDTSVPGAARIVGRFWYFGDGVTSTASSPTHTYGADDAYRVSLTVVDEDGNQDTVTKIVPAASVPITEIEDNELRDDQTAGSGEDLFYVIDVPSSAEELRIELDVGDETFGQTGANLYAHPGSFPGTDNYSFGWDEEDEGGFDERQIVVSNPSDGLWFIAVRSQSPSLLMHPALVVHLRKTSELLPSFQDDDGSTGLTFTFTDTSTPPSGGSIAQWRWEFGDGATSSAQNPVHTYASPGVYTVSLTVTDDAGNKRSINRKVNAFSLEGEIRNGLASPAVSLDPDEKKFFFLDVPAGLSTLDFNTNDPGSGSPQLYVKKGSLPTSAVYDGRDDFGAPLSVSIASPAEGRWYVRLVNNSSFSGLSGFTVTATFDAVSSAFTDTNTDLSFSFTDESVAASGETITDWTWDFGDGNGSSAQNPNHTYASAGTYTVTLTVLQSDGRISTYSKQVQATAP